MKFDEMKQRLDPACWHNKKIGNPKTKVKGGVRVNNCVPAESVEEDLTRRGFLKGLGAAAVAGAAGNSMSATLTKDEMNYVMFALDTIWVCNNSLYKTEPTHCEFVKKSLLTFWKQAGLTNSELNDTYAQISQRNEDELKKKDPAALQYFQQMSDPVNMRGIARGLTKFRPFESVQQGVTEAAKGIQHKVRYSYDDPSGNGTASGHITLHAPDKESAARYATSDLTKRGKKNVRVHAVTPQKVAEGATEVVGDTEQDQELRNYAQRTADRAREEIKNKMFNTLPMPGEDETVHEEDMNPEYNDEAGMADNNLSTLRRAVDGLDDLIDSGDNLPEWCQEKIAVAKSMLVAVWDYMESADDSEEEDPEVAEMYEAMESLAEEMARRNRVSVDRVWEQFEALPDNVLYETAAWRRKEGKSKTGGLNAKGVASYRRENPGSKLQTAVTTKPSKLKPGSKAAKRRKSFCARMSGVKGPMKKPNGKPTRKALALRKWNC